MPLSPSGVYSLPNGYLGVTGQDILPTQHNPPLEDVGAVLSEAFYRTGVAPMLANLNFNTFKGIGLANGTATTDAVNKSQLDALITYPTSTSFKVGNILVQFLQEGRTLNSGGGDTILFPVQYTGIPIVLVQNSSVTINSSLVELISVPTIAGFQIRTNPSTPSTLVGINWIAIGIKA